MTTRTLITILTWNRLKLTKNTVRSLFKNNVDNMRDILFIDNGSTDGTLEWIMKKGYGVIKNGTNEGIFRASTKAWMVGVDRKYDYILNLQNDFPCTRRIPFDMLEHYMDNNLDVGFIRLNKKKDKKKNLVTKEPIKYEIPDSAGGYTLAKNNYHAGFNPALIRSTIIKDFIVYEGDHPRERILMNNFNAMGLKCAKLLPEVFDTLKQGNHKGDWTH
jgi:glycosyltransferase involved in cell wall biosynthesis